MNKKMNFLAVLPLYGAIILLFWLYIKAIKKQINKKKFHVYFICSGIIGFLSILIIILFLSLINSLVNINDFINGYGLLVAFILGGYIFNLYTFTLINKKWNSLEEL